MTALPRLNIVDALVAPILESEARERQAKRRAAPRTYSIVWDDYGYFDGWNVMCDQTQSMMRDEPYERERDAQELLDRLAGGDEDEGSE